MTLEGHIIRQEREWTQLAHLWRDSETVELWTGPWIGLGHSVEVARAMALDFLLYCQMMGKAPTVIALMRWCEGNIGG